MEPYRGIKDIIGVQAPDRYLYDWPELGTAAIDEETMRRLHSDVRGVLDVEPEATRMRNLNREPHSDCIDSWGSGQCEVKPGQYLIAMATFTPRLAATTCISYQVRAR
jgi:uroporphyrinogen decarboxylase